VAELVDARDSKSRSSRGVWVRFPPSAPRTKSFFMKKIPAEYYAAAAGLIAPALLLLAPSAEIALIGALLSAPSIILGGILSVILYQEVTSLFSPSTSLVLALMLTNGLIYYELVKLFKTADRSIWRALGLIGLLTFIGFSIWFLLNFLKGLGGL
jgi:hypothetical protein